MRKTTWKQSGPFAEVEAEALFDVATAAAIISALACAVRRLFLQGRERLGLH